MYMSQQFPFICRSCQVLQDAPECVWAATTSLHPSAEEEEEVATFGYVRGEGGNEEDD